MPFSFTGLIGTAQLLDASVIYQKLKIARALVSSSVNQPVGASAFLILTWNTENLDEAALHDIGVNPSRFTVPTGYTKAILSGNVEWAGSNSGQRFTRILYNGFNLVGHPRWAYPNNGVSAQSHSFCSPMIECAAGDFFQLQVFQDTIAALNVTGGNVTWFGILLLG